MDLYDYVLIFKPANVIKNDPTSNVLIDYESNAFTLGAFTVPISRIARDGTASEGEHRQILDAGPFQCMLQDTINHKLYLRHTYNIGYQVQNGNGNKRQDKNVLIFHSREDERVTASAISVSYAGFLTNHHKCNLIIGRPDCPTCSTAKRGRSCLK